MMKIGVILLAAGAGKRFGGSKLTAEIQGKTLYMEGIGKLKKLETFGPKAVVTGNSEIADTARRHKIFPVWNDQPDKGVSLSIQLGIEAVERLDDETEAFMFMVCDQPGLKVSTLNRMIKDYRDGILELGYQGRHGNPVIFSRDYAEELKKLSGDMGGRRVLENHRDKVKVFEAEDISELWDIDTRKNLEDLVKKGERVNDR